MPSDDPKWAYAKILVTKMRDSVLSQDDKRNADTELILHKKFNNELDNTKYNKDKSAASLCFEYMQIFYPCHIYFIFTTYTCLKNCMRLLWLLFYTWQQNKQIEIYV